MPVGVLTFVLKHIMADQPKALSGFHCRSSSGDSLPSDGVMPILRNFLEIKDATDLAKPASDQSQVTWITPVVAPKHESKKQSTKDHCITAAQSRNHVFREVVDEDILVAV